MAEISAYYKDIWAIFGCDLPWERLSGSNILVTGATGLIGGCLTEALMMNPLRNYQVFASGRDESRLRHRFNRFHNDPGLHFLIMEVTSPLDCNYSFDYIIHAASYAGPAAFAEMPVEVMKSNIDGVCNLITYGMRNGMKRFVYLSSGEVYGEGDGREFTEDYSGYVDCSSPRSCYPSSKRAAESLCASYKAEYGVDVVIARPCHTYGPYFSDSDNRVFAQFIRNILNDQDIVMKSSGEQYRSWCYVVDCVSGILHILLKGASGEAYNIANPESDITIKELAAAVAEIGDKKVILASPGQRESAGYNPVSKSVYSVKKIKSLGWEPKTSLKTGFRHSIDELLNCHSS